MLKSGDLVHRITINSMPLGTADAFGARAATPTFFARAWASIDPVAGRELAVARNYSATVTHKIGMRYIPGVLPTMQIVYTPPDGSARTFAINAVIDPGERRKELTIFCTEKLSA